MSDNNIVRFPVKRWKQIENQRGKNSVSCMVTMRWLAFGGTAQKVDFGGGDVGTMVFVHVMTETDDKPRKLCELCIKLEDLHKVLGNIEVKEESA